MPIVIHCLNDCNLVPLLTVLVLLTIFFSELPAVTIK